MLKNTVLMCAVASWFTAQVIKVILNWRKTKRLQLSRLFGMGGMPSSHTAFFVSLTAMVGKVEGLYSTAFAISAGLAMVIIYDAMGVRYETGKQGKTLNKIIGELLEGGIKITEDRLMEIVGHTPLEVIFGALIGIIVPLIFWL